MGGCCHRYKRLLHLTDSDTENGIIISDRCFKPTQAIPTARSTAPLITTIFLDDWIKPYLIDVLTLWQWTLWARVFNHMFVVDTKKQTKKTYGPQWNASWKVQTDSSRKIVPLGCRSQKEFRQNCLTAPVLVKHANKLNNWYLPIKRFAPATAHLGCINKWVYRPSHQFGPCGTPNDNIITLSIYSKRHEDHYWAINPLQRSFMRETSGKMIYQLITKAGQKASFRLK